MQITNSNSQARSKITPFLWFNNQAEEAARFYTSIFKNSKLNTVRRVGDGAGGTTVISADFQLEGQDFMALNGGPHFTFTPAISFFVSCDTQQEVDDLWDKLSQGGKTQRCGWVQDKFGLSWQIIPTILGELMGDEDAEKAERVMNAMLEMEKIDIQRLQQAYDAA